MKVQSHYHECRFIDCQKCISADFEWVGLCLAQKVGESLRGEMTVVEPHPKLVHFSLIETLAETMRLSSSEVRHSSHHCAH